MAAIMMFPKVTKAQDLMAQVQISDGNTKINQLATYRTSLFVVTSDSSPSFAAGTIFKFYLSEKVSLQTPAGNPTNIVTICRRYFAETDTSQAYSQCSYDQTERYVQITLTQTNYFVDTYNFEVGFIKNPAIADQDGDYNFRVTVQEPSGNILFDVYTSSPVLIYPGDITTPSVTPSSLKVADTCIYTFYFQVSDPQFGDTGIDITFPSEISVPVGLTTSDISVQVYNGTNITGSSLSFSLVRSSTITLNNPFQGNALTPVANKYITVTIRKVRNPTSMKQSSSFQITTFDGSTVNPISQVVSGITVTPSLPGDITAATDTPRPLQPIVSASTSIYFDISLPFKYSTGGYLLVTFPSESKIGQTQTCQISIGFGDTTPKCTFSATSPQTVKITNQLSSGTSTRLIFYLGQATNPSTTKPTSTFMIQAFDQQNYLISQRISSLTYTSTPATITTAASVRSLSTVGAQTGNTLTLSFTAPSALFNGERIYMKVPYDQFLVGTSGQVTCRAAAGSQNLASVSCTLDIASNSSYFIVHMASPCPIFCAAGSTYTVELSGVRNPEWIAPSITRSIEVQTMTSDLLWLKDRRITQIFTTPSLTEGIISSRTITKNNNVVNQNAEIVVSFVLNNRIPANGYIVVVFPQGGFFNPASGSVTCSDPNAPTLSLSCVTTLYNDNTQGIQLLNITSRCPTSTSCLSGQTLTISITNIRNRPSVKTFSNYFEIRTYTVEQFRIDVAQISNEVQNLVLTYSQYISLKRILPVTPIITGALDTYQFKMISQNGVFPNGMSKHEIFFPDEIKFPNLTQGQSASCSATCSNSYLNCLIWNKADKKLIITNNDPSQSFANQEITITLPTYARNPQTTKQSGNFKFQTSLYDVNDQQYYLQDYDQSMTITADTPNNLLNVVAQRTDQIINNPSDYYLTFTTFNPIPANSIIQISYPKDQVYFTAAQTRILYDNFTGNVISPISYAGDDSSFATHVSYNFIEWCSIGSLPCPSGTTLSVKLTGVVNPPSTRTPKNTYKIIIITPDGYFTDQILSGVQTIPLLSAGPFQSVSYQESNTIVGEISQLQVIVKINNPITSGQQGRFKIILPNDMYYMPLTGSIQCQSDNVIVECVQITGEGNFGTYVSLIDINLGCLTSSCSKDTQRTFTILNLRNRFSTKSLSGSISVLTVDDDQYTFDSSSTMLTNSQLQLKLQPALGGIFTSITRSVKNTFTSTDLSLVFNINVRFVKNANIQVFIPKDQFDLDSSQVLKCLNSGTNAQIPSCTLLSNNDPLFFGVQFKEFCLSGSASPYCPENYAFQLTVSGFKNRYNTKPSSSSLYFKTYTSEMDNIEQSYNQVIPAKELIPQVGSINASYILSNQQVGSSTNMNITFNLQNRISQNDYLYMAFDNPIFRVGGTPVVCGLAQSPQYSYQNITCTSQIVNGMLQSIEFQVKTGSSSQYQGSILVYNILNLLEDKPHNTNIQINSYTIDGNNVYGISNSIASIINRDILVPSNFQTLNFQRSEKKLIKPADITVNFTSPFSIMPSSKIQVLVPKAQLYYDEANTLSCKLNDNNIGCQKVSENTTYAVFSTDKSLCLSNDCTSNTAFSFFFTGFKNPEYMALTPDPIFLEIISPNDFGILRQGAKILPDLQLGVINDLVVKQTGNLTTGSLTTFEVTFRFDSDLDSTFRVFIRFPSMTISPPMDGVTPELACFDMRSNKQINCIVKERQSGYITLISLENFCTIATCSSSVKQLVKITNIANVEYVRPRLENITILEVLPQNYISSQGYISLQSLPTLLATNLTMVNVTRATTRPGASSVEIKFTFKTPYRIPNRSLISYIIPREQQLLPEFTRVVCSSADKGGDSDLDCDVEVRNTTHVVLKMQEWCAGDCAPNTTISMKITRSTNPLSLQANDPDQSIGVYIETQEGYAVSQNFTDIVITPKLDEITMDNVFLMRDRNVLGSDDNITMAMTVPPNLPSSVRITFTFPFNTTFQPLNAPQRCLLLRNITWRTMSCSYNFFTNTTEVFGLKSLQNITITGFCTSTVPCREGDTFIISLQISNNRAQIVVGDPENVWKLEPYKIILSTDKFDLGITKIPYNITQLDNGLIRTTIRNETCQRTGQLCPLNMDIITQNPFSGNLFTQLLITLPQEIIIPNGASCTARVLTKTMNCRFLSNREIQLRHSIFFTPKEYASMNYGFRINLTVSQVIYPQTTEQTGVITLGTFERWNKTILSLDQAPPNITFRVNSPNSFGSIRAIRTSVEPNTRTNLIINITTGVTMSRDAYLNLQIPASQLVLDFSITKTPLCFRGVNITGAQMYKCSFVEDKTIQIRDICAPNGCPNNTRLLIGIASTILYNPEFEADFLDSYIDSIKVTTYINSTRDKMPYIYESYTNSLYVQPKMSILEDLRIADANIETDKAYDFQRLNFKAVYLTKKFSKDYLRVKFFFTNFVQDPFYPIKVKVNKATANITNINNTDSGAIDYIIFDCKKITCKTQSELNIVIEGFRNPEFKIINSTNTPRVQFGELVQRPGRLYTSNSTTIQNNFDNMKILQVVNSQTRFSDYQISANNTSLELLFSIEENPLITSRAQVQIQLPSGYSVPSNLTCIHLFTNQSFSCKAQNGTITINNVFSLQSALVQSRLRQLQNTTNAPSTNIQANTVVAIRLLNVTNPSMTQINSSLGITITSGSSLYALDTNSLTVSSMRVSNSSCQDSNCALCSFIDPRICVSCKSPSAAPILQGYSCKETCDPGYFEFNKQCYRCSYGCKECQTYDQCISCNYTQKILVDGQCLDKVTKYQQVLQCPDGSLSSPIYGCFRNKSCQQDECEVCGADFVYCLQCNNNKVALNGLCVNQCPSGYTTTQRRLCRKCDPSCGTCDKSAKNCTSCRLDFYDAFKLDLTKSKCTQTCQDGSILKQTDNSVCEACDDSCYSCSEKKDKCTQCYYHKKTFKDLFLLNDKCIEECPSGYYQNFKTHVCEKTEFQVGNLGTLYLIFAIIVSALITLASHIRTGKKDISSNVIIFFLTQIEFINRILFLACLWKTTQVLPFTFTGMNVLGNALFGIYFATNVVWPIANQLKLAVFQTSPFTILTVLSQFTGVNTLRLTTSRFFLLRTCCLPTQYATLPFYVRHLETLNGLSLTFTLCQLLVGVSCLRGNPYDSLVFAFGLNAIVLNTLLLVFQSVKYRKYQRLQHEYAKVDQQPAQTNNQVPPRQRLRSSNGFGGFAAGSASAAPAAAAGYQSNGTVVTSQGESESRVGSAQQQMRRSQQPQSR